MRTVRAEVFPIESGRWVAVVEGFDFSTEAPCPQQVPGEVAAAVRQVLGWDQVEVELRDEVGGVWLPSHAPAQAARMGVAL